MIYMLVLVPNKKSPVDDRALFLVLSIDTSYPVMRVSPATATTAIIACTDRVVFLFMFNGSTHSSKTKNPGFKAGVRNFFLNNIRPSRMNFPPLRLLPEELLCSWA